MCPHFIFQAVTNPAYVQILHGREIVEKLREFNFRFGYSTRSVLKETSHKYILLMTLKKEARLEKITVKEFLEHFPFQLDCRCPD